MALSRSVSASLPTTLSAMLFTALFASIASIPPALHAATCVSQAAMPVATRTALSTSAQELGGFIATANIAQVRARTIPQYASDFAGIEGALRDSGSHFAGGVTLKSLWLLDATDQKANADGSLPDVPFVCPLQNSYNSVSMTIASLPAGRYALTIAEGTGAAPWRLSMLLQEVAGKWMLAGYFPHEMTLSGHDGLWFWTTGRSFVAKKEPWNAWLHFNKAHDLLQPVPFLGSTHLDKLEDETQKTVPTALSQGLNSNTPLVLKAADGSDVMVTNLEVDATSSGGKLYLAVHTRVDSVADTAAARAKNHAAALALAKAYPELKGGFEGMWVYAEAQNQPPLPTQESF